MLKKYKPNGEIEFRPVYFISTTKAAISHKFSLENAFQEVLYRIDNWINEGSGWIFELIKSQYINVSAYRPLSGSSYVKLPAELGSPKKGLINIKNKYQNVFCGVMLAILIPLNYIQKELQRRIENLLMILIMMESNFLCKKKILARLKQKNNTYINIFCHEDRLTFPI